MLTCVTSTLQDSQHRDKVRKSWLRTAPSFSLHYRKYRRKQLTRITQVEIHHILQFQLPVTDRIHTQDTRANAHHVSSLRQHQSKAKSGTKSKSGTKATSLHPKVDTSKWDLDTPCKTARCLPNVGNLLLLKLAIKMIKRGL